MNEETPRTLTARILRAARGRRAVAFDVFDTLLLRACAKPADLFTLMEQTGRGAPGFAARRAQAEAAARQPGREVTLAEIYAQPALSGMDPAAECAAELAAALPNPPVAAAARACHARGQAVYAVSDMYLPKAQIEAMLAKCGLDFLDGVFVSAEYGVQKRSGKLFRRFLAETGLAPRDVLFVGDSPRADAAGAALAGIGCFLLPKPAPLPYTPPPADAAEGACSAMVRGVGAALPEPQAAGAELVGPLVTAFAVWLHARRAALPGAKLVFLARDMELVRRVYGILYPQEETAYLKVSRQSLLPALLQDPQDERMLALAADALPRQTLTRAQIETYLGLPPTPGPAGEQRFDLRTRPLAGLTQALLRALAAQAQTPAGARLRAQAALVRQYLEQAGLSEGPVLLADIGSGGTTQRALEAILGTPLHGCYLACDERLHRELPPQRAEAFLFGAQPAPLWYWAGQPMLEVFLSEPCGPTVGYALQNGRAVPQTGPALPGNAAIVAPLRLGAEAFARGWRTGPAWGLALPPDYCCAAFLRMVRAPRLCDARRYGAIAVEDGGVWKLAAPDAWRAYLRRPANLGRDFAQARWKTAFLRRLFRLPLPYGALYAAMKRAGN